MRGELIPSHLPQAGLRLTAVVEGSGRVFDDGADPSAVKMEFHRHPVQGLRALALCSQVPALIALYD